MCTMKRGSAPGSSWSSNDGARSGRLIQNAVALMISAGGSAVFGLAFWGVAAHLASPEAVGRTSAEIVAMIMLANLAQLSFGSIFERFLPVAGDRTRSFIQRAYSMCIATALVLAIIYVYSGLGHRVVPHTVFGQVFFVVTVVMWTIFILQDNALVGLRASRWVPVENILFAIAKLALLPVMLSVSAGQGVFLAWSAPVVLTLIAVNWYLFARRIPEHESLKLPNESLPKTRELFLLAGAQYATLLFSVFTPSIVALIVIERLGAVANAHYYVPSLIYSGLALIVVSIIRSFLVEAASEPYALRRHTNMAIIAMTAVIIPSVIIGVIFASNILQIFGTQYADRGTTLLRMMLLSLPLSSVPLFYSTFAWLDRRVWWMTVRNLVDVVVFFCVMFALIGREGILSIGIGFLVSSALQGIFFLPISIRRYRLTTNTDPPTVGTFTSPT
jgi:O-antigen/teichoic acid export membrane protein